MMYINTTDILIDNCILYVWFGGECGERRKNKRDILIKSKQIFDGMYKGIHNVFYPEILLTYFLEKYVTDREYRVDYIYEFLLKIPIQIVKFDIDYMEEVMKIKNQNKDITMEDAILLGIAKRREFRILSGDKMENFKDLYIE